MTRKKKIYIAGKVTGLNYSDVKQKFRATENQLFSEGYQVVNPIELCNEESTWEDAMKICIEALADCDEIFMLNDWKDSRGATLEHKRAIELDIPIHYQKTTT